MTCQHPGTNHSKDRVTVYHGNPQPATLCGYHAKYHLRDALRLVRLKNKAAANV